MRTASHRIRAFIDASADLAGLPLWHIYGEAYKPGEWLEGLILQESSGRPDVRRYEPHLDKQPDGDTPHRDDGFAEDDASWGPMQVLGVNVKRILGASPTCALTRYNALYDWHIGMAFGLAVLRLELVATQNDVTRALCRYNGGPTGDVLMPSGSYRRQVYADGVQQKAAQVRADRLAARWKA